MSSDNLSLSNYDRLEQKKQYNSVKNNKLFKFNRFLQIILNKKKRLLRNATASRLFNQILALI